MKFTRNDTSHYYHRQFHQAERANFKIIHTIQTDTVTEFIQHVITPRHESKLSFLLTVERDSLLSDSTSSFKTLSSLNFPSKPGITPETPTEDSDITDNISSASWLAHNYSIN